MSTAKPEFIDWPWLKIELSEAKGAHSSSENLMRYCAPGEPGGFGIEKWLIAQFNGPEVEAGLSAPRHVRDERQTFAKPLCSAVSLQVRHHDAGQDQ